MCQFLCTGSSHSSMHLDVHAFMVYPLLQIAADFKFQYGKRITFSDIYL